MGRVTDFANSIQYGTSPHFIIAISRSPVSELSRITGWKVWGAAL
jgi:hypothetical protein